MVFYIVYLFVFCDYRLRCYFFFDKFVDLVIYDNILERCWEI